MNIGEKIKHFRELRNFDQKYMAKSLDIHQATFSKIENGHDPSFSQVEDFTEVVDAIAIDATGWPTGVYMLQAIQGDYVQLKKLIVQH